MLKLLSKYTGHNEKCALQLCTLSLSFSLFFTADLMKKCVTGRSDPQDKVLAIFLFNFCFLYSGIVLQKWIMLLGFPVLTKKKEKAMPKILPGWKRRDFSVGAIKQ